MNSCIVNMRYFTVLAFWEETSVLCIYLFISTLVSYFMSQTELKWEQFFVCFLLNIYFIFNKNVFQSF